MYRLLCALSSAWKQQGSYTGRESRRNRGQQGHSDRSIQLLASPELFPLWVFFMCWICWLFLLMRVHDVIFSFPVCRVPFGCPKSPNICLCGDQCSCWSVGLGLVCKFMSLKSNVDCSSLISCIKCLRRTQSCSRVLCRQSKIRFGGL